MPPFKFPADVLYLLVFFCKQDGSGVPYRHNNASSLNGQIQEVFAETDALYFGFSEENR
jgi:hypothetical protein